MNEKEGKLPEVKKVRKPRAKKEVKQKEIAEAIN